MSCVVLSRSDDVVFLVIEVFHPVSEPSCDSRDSEEYWEHICWESHCSVDDTRVEVDVWVELSFDEELIFEGDFLKSHRDFYERFTAADLEYFFSGAFHDLRTRIVVFIYTMAESEQ